MIPAAAEERTEEDTIRDLIYALPSDQWRKWMLDANRISVENGRAPLFGEELLEALADE